eukprot:11180167-Lingulodinium_polyedra.AAC.1
MDREDAVASIPLGNNGYLSIVEHHDAERGDKHVTLVNWRYPESFLGQIVKLDEKHRIKFSPVALYPYMNFADCKVIHPAVPGARQYKVTASGRLEFPPAALTLKRMWEAAIAGGMGGGVSLCSPCLVCSGSGPGPQGTLPGMCPLCLMTWHQECSARLCEMFGQSEHWPRGHHIPANLLDCRIPEDFLSKGVLCGLCEQSFGDH